MKAAVVGCGYVAAMYAKTAPSYTELDLYSAFDSDANRLSLFCNKYQCVAADSLSDLLADPQVEMVLNLTNPREHFSVSEACLNAGKHVYTEKPIGMTLEEAQKLQVLAEAKGVRIGCAPCGVLSNTAQTVWSAISDGMIGKVRMVYANYDDGMIAPSQQPWTWKNEVGVPWPAKDEFEVGCTFEHAGYFLSWLNTFFGPAREMTAYSSCQVPDKGIPVDQMAPDFSVGCIEYDNGVVARVTCGLVAPRDKSLTIVGDNGVLYVNYLRNDHETVWLRREERSKMVLRIENKFAKLLERAPWLTSWVPWPTRGMQIHQRVPFVLPVKKTFVGRNKRVDFMLGPVDMAQAIRDGRPHKLNIDFGLHILEQVEMLQYPDRFGHRKSLATSFAPMARMGA